MACCSQAALQLCARRRRETSDGGETEADVDVDVDDAAAAPVARVAAECANDVWFARERFSCAELEALVRQKKRPTQLWPRCGIVEARLCATLTFFFSSLLELSRIEITRVEVFPRFRNRGVMLDFVRRLQEAATKGGSGHSALVMGCVVPDGRMASIMRENAAAWTRCADDPTSFALTRVFDEYGRGRNTSTQRETPNKGNYRHAGVGGARVTARDLP